MPDPTTFALLFLLSDGSLYASPVPSRHQCWTDMALSYAELYRHHVATRLRGRITAPTGVTVQLGWSVACVEIEPCDCEATQ